MYYSCLVYLHKICSFVTENDLGNIGSYPLHFSVIYYCFIPNEMSCYDLNVPNCYINKNFTN